jgi:leader peptidase (prepilin peptidase)/N-methyltransferase
MDIILILQHQLYLAAFITGIFGLIFGSFLNVVIARYPGMLYRRWQHECQEHLHIPQTEPTESANLFSPASRCPHCKTPIKAWHNIPIIGYLFLGGKCAHCRASISLIYPLVEAITAISGVIVILHFGWNFTALAALIFTWTLITLSFIDFQEHILPDNITLTLLWVGLLLNCTNYFTTPINAILGAVIAYSSLWTVATLFKIIRKKDGMGNGDFKLFACVGAWLGASALLTILLIAVLSCLIVSILLLVMRKMKKEQPVPFGPFIALGAFLTLLFGTFQL